MKIVLLAAVAAVCLPVPGYAAASVKGEDSAALPAGLACVRNGLSAEEWRGLVQLLGEDGSPEDRRAEPLGRAIDACDRQPPWSAQKRSLAGTFMAALAGVTAIREEFGRRGIRIEDLDATILSDRALMEADESGRRDPEVGRDFALRHIPELQRIAAGHPLDSELGNRIGTYVGFRVLMEITPRGFEREP